MTTAAPTYLPGKTSPTLILSRINECERQCGLSQPVSQGLRRMNDEEREAAIERAGNLMLKRYAVWADEGCFAALGDAHHAYTLMKTLIAGRSEEQVARMELMRGLA